MNEERKDGRKERKKQRKQKKNHPSFKLTNNNTHDTTYPFLQSSQTPRTPIYQERAKKEKSACHFYSPTCQTLSKLDKNLT
jgi:hypothetical protein